MLGMRYLWYNQRKYFQKLLLMMFLVVLNNNLRQVGCRVEEVTSVVIDETVFN
jgi:hypothetical protein